MTSSSVPAFPGRGLFGTRVERVVVLADGTKPEVRPRLTEVVDFLKGRDLDVHVDEDVRGFCNECEDTGPDLSIEGPHLVVVLGGDGSVLTAVRAFGAKPVPVLGINYGRVGFLAPVKAERWREGLLDALEGRAIQEMRMRMQVVLPQGQVRSALNDAVISRSPDAGMVTLALLADGDQVATYRADGLILATPSGSTAYSLAAGGPILAPTMQGMVVTPISAHALAHRPLVLAPEAQLSVEVQAGPAILVVDGQPAGSVDIGERVEVQRAPEPYPLLMPAGMDPWRRLRDRMGWSGSLPER